MSMKLDPNPLHWSSDLKALGQLITIIITVIGAVGGGAIYLGKGIYAYAEAQTELVQLVKNMQGQIIDERIQIQDGNTRRDRSFIDLKGDLEPRITGLEKSIHEAETEAAAAHARADDMKEDLKELKNLAARNLSVSESHDADIKATAKAVGAAGDPGPPGR